MECKIKRTGLVENFPFVDGRRPVKRLLGSDETKFEMVRCVDETCQESDNNAVLDISPYSMDDPMIWFKVSWSYIGVGIKLLRFFEDISFSRTSSNGTYRVDS